MLCNGFRYELFSCCLLAGATDTPLWPATGLTGSRGGTSENGAMYC